MYWSKSNIRNYQQLVQLLMLIIMKCQPNIILIRPCLRVDSKVIFLFTKLVNKLDGSPDKMRPYIGLVNEELHCVAIREAPMIQ